jgi:hypothetical protein
MSSVLGAAEAIACCELDGDGEGLGREGEMKKEPRKVVCDEEEMERWRSASEGDRGSPVYFYTLRETLSALVHTVRVFPRLFNTPRVDLARRSVCCHLTTPDG